MSQVDTWTGPSDSSALAPLSLQSSNQAPRSRDENGLDEVKSGPWGHHSQCSIAAILCIAILMSIQHLMFFTLISLIFNPICAGADYRGPCTVMQNLIGSLRPILLIPKAFSYWYYIIKFLQIQILD